MRRVLSAMVVVTACGHPSPQIKSFRVEPAGYCPSAGQKIRVSWKTEKGATTLQVAPDDSVPRTVDAVGSFEFPAHDAVVTLTVRKGALAPHVVQPVRAVDHHNLSALATGCGNGWVWSEPTEFGGGNNAFASDVHPGAISNKCKTGAAATATCHRHVQVVHGTNTWDVAPDAVVNVTSSNAPMSGTWILKQELLPGEQCNSQSAAAALEIDLSLEIGCSGGATYEQ